MTLPRNIFALVLLASITLCLHGLPITSKPLDNSPDHLTWDALLTIKSYQPEPHEVRKIPKSIFITPNFNESAVQCKPGYKLDPRDNKCYKENIAVDQLSLLAMQALQSFSNQPVNPTPQNSGSSADSFEYDYEDEESRYEIPLSVSFAEDSSVTKVTDPKSFLAGGTQKGATNNLTRRTTYSLPATIPYVQSTTSATSTTTSSPLGLNAHVLAASDYRPVYSVAPLETVAKETGGAITIQKTEPVTTTTETPSVSETTTELQTTESVLLNTIPTTTNEDPEAIESESMIAQNKLALAQLVDSKKQMETAFNNQLASNIGDEDLKKALKAESLFRDERPLETTTSGDVMTSTTTDSMDGTTEVPETTTISLEKPTDETKIVTDRLEPSEGKESANDSPPMIILPTKDAIQVVTPEVHESSTPIVDSVIAATELLHKISGVDTEATKHQRQTMMNNEMNADELETIDQRNRFVYTHLAFNPTDAPVTTTPEPPTTTPRPVHPTPRLTLRQQLALFHQRTEEYNKRPKDTNHPPQPSLFSNYRSRSPVTTIRFENSPMPTGHQRFGDRSQPPLFTWLPSNYKFERSGGRDGRPTIKERPALKFWNEMPLIRDPALMGGQSTDRAARANSRSPTEQLFRQEESPAADVYKVVSTKNAQYQNR